MAVPGETRSESFQRHQRMAQAGLTLGAAVPAVLALRRGRAASTAGFSGHAAAQSAHAAAQLRHAATATGLGGLAGAVGAFPTPHRLLGADTPKRHRQPKPRSLYVTHRTYQGAKPAASYTNSSIGKREDIMIDAFGVARPDLVDTHGGVSKAFDPEAGLTAVKDVGSALKTGFAAKPSVAGTASSFGQAAGKLGGLAKPAVSGAKTGFAGLKTGLKTGATSPAQGVLPGMTRPAEAFGQRLGGTIRQHPVGTAATVGGGAVGLAGLRRLGQPQQQNSFGKALSRNQMAGLTAARMNGGSPLRRSYASHRLSAASQGRHGNVRAGQVMRGKSREAVEQLHELAIPGRYSKSEIGKDDRFFSEKFRRTKKAHAMSGGSFPIPDKDALDRAKQSVGRAKDKAAARAHINAQAKRLGEPGIGKADLKVGKRQSAPAAPDVWNRPDLAGITVDGGPWQPHFDPEVAKADAYYGSAPVRNQRYPGTGASTVAGGLSGAAAGALAPRAVTRLRTTKIGSRVRAAGLALKTAPK